jgi:acetyl-CoA C-acetyltransferase
MLFVDQSAACIMMSKGLARTIGIPDEHLVYLHGCGDAYESQTTLFRPSLHRSEATRLAGDRAMTQAGITPDQIGLVDLYTCFPIAAQAAAREFGLDSTDGKKMTLIGGLMYNGGPGANTAMHGLAAMVPKLRSQAGSYGVSLPSQERTLVLLQG